MEDEGSDGFKSVENVSGSVGVGDGGLDLAISARGEGMPLAVGLVPVAATEVARAAGRFVVAVEGGIALAGVEGEVLADEVAIAGGRA